MKLKGTHSCRRLPGFTLIELLVVVAIIGLLISILLPSLKRAKDSARQVKCMTNMKALFAADLLYAADNKQYIARGKQWENPNDMSHPGKLYQIFPTAVLPYLNYDGYIDRTKLKRQRVREVYIKAVLQFEVFRDPAYPAWYDAENHATEAGQGFPTNPQHFVTSTFPIPYTQKNIDYDNAEDLRWREDAEWDEVPADLVDYWGASRLDKWAPGVNPSDFVFMTAVDKSIPWDIQRAGLEFYTVFLTRHVPFSVQPRVDDLPRHPNGHNCFFFDGHGKVIDVHKLDRGYPNDLGKRLEYFTVMPEGWTP